MKSLMTFLGFLAFIFTNFAQSADFLCPLNANYANYSCAGTVRVQNIEQLNAYKNNLGISNSNPTVAKSLLIDFNANLNEELIIATPCAIKTSLNISITANFNICLNAKKGILIEEGFNFNGKNLKLESSEDVIINKNSNLIAQDIRLLTKGTELINQAFIRDGAQIEASNLVLESAYKGFIGRNSNINISGTFGVYSRGDDEATVREGARVEANKIDIQSSIKTTIANLTTLIANDLHLNGSQSCGINPGATLTAVNKTGNCFLGSLTVEKFSIDKSSGTSPLTVTFNANTISSAKGYIWNFGDGQILKTLSPVISHTFTNIGVFTVSLMFATQDNYKALKSAGSVQVDVKAPVVIPTTPPRGYFTYSHDGTYVYLKSFIRKTQFEIANAYYVIDDNFNRKVFMTNFYSNSMSSVEMNTFGSHKVTMYVEDVQGQKYNTTLNVWLSEEEENIFPVIRFYGEQSAINTLFINMGQSFVPALDENLKNFTVNFGDGNIEQVENASSVIHMYNNPGTYNVTVSAEYNGNIRSNTLPITVTNSNKPVLNPIAGFYYYVLEYSGNVVLTDDRSQSPNGEIISYEWDFGNGMKTYGQQASHFFSPGNHLVTLTITDIAGLKSSQTQLIKVEQTGSNLVASLAYSNVFNKDLELEFFALDNSNQISRVKIDWGDGNSKIYNQAEVSPWGLYSDNHTYSQFGSYLVKLTVDTSRGQTKIDTRQVKIDSRPIANLVCYSNFLLVNCNAFGSYDPFGTPLIYEFNYGDGKVVTNTTGLSSHAFSLTGFNTIKLTVKSQNGNLAVAESQVQVFSFNNNESSLNMTCNNFKPYELNCNLAGSVDSDGTILIYKLTLSEKEFEQGNSNFIIRNLSAGIKNLKITLIDSKGGVSNFYRDVEVIPNSAPVITSMTCESRSPFKVDCTGSSLDQTSETPLKFEWDFGTGYIANLNSNASFTYQSAGAKNIKFKVTDSYGEFTTSSVQVFVKDNASPVSIMNCGQDNQNPDQFGCLSSSYDLDGNIVEVKWTLSNGTIFYGNQFLVNLTNETYIEVKLDLMDNLGAVTSEVKSFNVVPNRAPSFDIYADINSGKIPLNTIFYVEDVKDDSGIKKAEWVLENGEVVPQTNLSGVIMLHQQFTTDGPHKVTFRVYDVFNKMTEKTLSVSVGDVSEYKINASKEEFKVGEIINLSLVNNSNETVIGSNCRWYLNEKLLGIGTNINTAITEAGISQVILEIKTANNSNFTIRKDLIVQPGEIYLSGSLTGSVGVGDEYRAILKINHSDLVNEENILIELLESPDGALFDEEKLELTWIPSAPGSFDVAVKITDGNFVYIKKGIISVLNQTSVSTMNVTNEYQNINDINSALNGFQIYTNTEDIVPIQIIETKTSEGVDVSFKTSSQYRGAIELKMPNSNLVKQVKINKSTEKFFNKSSDFSTLTNGDNYLYQKEITVCPGAKYKLINKDFLNANNSKLNSTIVRASFSEIFSGRGRLWVSENVKKRYLELTSEGAKVKKLVDKLMLDTANLNLDELSKFNFTANIYLTTSDETPQVKGVLGAHDMDNLDVAYLNLDRLLARNNDEIATYTLFHELYHILQSRVLDCREIKFSDDMLKAQSLFDGSAEAFALTNLGNVNKVNSILQSDVFIDDWAPSKDFYKATFRSGLLNAGNTIAAYKSFYFWTKYQRGYRQSGENLNFLNILKNYEQSLGDKALVLNSNFAETLMSDFISPNQDELREHLLNINETLYRNNAVLTGEGGGAYLAVPGIVWNKLFTYDFKFTDYPINTSSVIINPYGGNFYIFKPVSSDLLSFFPSLITVQGGKDIGVRGGVDLSINQGNGSGIEVINEDQSNGTYKFILFGAAFKVNELKADKVSFLSLVNVSKQLNIASVKKNTLCKTLDVELPEDVPNDSVAVLKISCESSCSAMRNYSVICYDNESKCETIQSRSKADSLEKVYQIYRTGKIVSCRVKVDPEKNYSSPESLEFEINGQEIIKRDKFANDYPVEQTN